MRRPAVRLAALLLVVAVAVGLAGGCRKSKDKAAPRPTTTASTAPPATGRGLAGVPSIESATTGTTGPGGCYAVPGQGDPGAAPHPDMPPLAAGTRFLQRVNPQPGQTLVVAASPETLPQMQERIRTQWRPGGWRELAGESEPGREVEGVFQRQDVRIGMRARVLYCDSNWLEVRIVVNRPMP